MGWRALCAPIRFFIRKCKSLREHPARNLWTHCSWTDINWYLPYSHFWYHRGAFYVRNPKWDDVNLKKLTDTNVPKVAVGIKQLLVTFKNPSSVWQCLVVGLTCGHRAFVEAGSKGIFHEKKMKEGGLDIFFQVNGEPWNIETSMLLKPGVAGRCRSQLMNIRHMQAKVFQTLWEPLMVSTFLNQAPQIQGFAGVLGTLE